MSFTDAAVDELINIPSEWDILKDLLDPPTVGWTPGWTPFPKQELAADLAMKATVTLFGGSAGPGKSALLCEFAIREMRRHPNNRGLIVRRIFSALNRTIIPSLKLRLRGLAVWSEKSSSFMFPNGSVLECKSIQYVDDVQEFQGAELGFIGVEEITEFAESQIEFLITRLRAPADGISPKMMVTANPGGRGHRFVKRWFVRPQPDDVHPLSEELPGPYVVWLPRPPNWTESTPPPIVPQTRCFVPALAEDNPALLLRDPGYIERLKGIRDRRLREAMLKGDWDAIDAVDGAQWSMDDLDTSRVSPEWFDRNITSWQRVIALDPSDGERRGDKFGMSVCSKGDDGRGYVHYAKGIKLPTRRKIVAHAIAEYHKWGCSHMVIERNHGGQWLPELILEIDSTIRIKTVFASDGKRTRAEPVAALFEQDGSSKTYSAVMVGMHPDLEELLTTTVFEPGEPSPDEIDAMVWALTDLCLSKRRQVKAISGGLDDQRGYER